MSNTCECCGGSVGAAGESQAVREQVDNYYKFRGLKEPDAVESMLFLLSEVGELAGALPRKDDPELFEYLAYDMLDTVIRFGEAADILVSKRGGWTRNNGRAEKVADLDGELGDVLMMLDRVAQASGRPDVSELLRAKMARKGFKV